VTELLRVERVVKRFGGVHAVDEVSFQLDGPTVLGLIGPNGSGKTTLLGILAGTHAPTRGRVLLDGAVVSGRKPHRTLRAGITRTFQTSRLFPSWTLGDAMRLAAHESHRGARRGPSVGEVAELLHLSSLLDRPCGRLTSAQQRLAMIAAALSSNPKVLLLDEPAVGMDLDEAAILADAVRRIRGELDTAVIVVDHNMHFLMPLAENVLVMASGKVLASGTPAQVRANEDVIASYLGS
jgi:branched-chain amino acid transport system ATP-binding protein